MLSYANLGKHMHKSLYLYTITNFHMHIVIIHNSSAPMCCVQVHCIASTSAAVLVVASSILINSSSYY